MSIVALFKAAANSSKTAKLLKAGKGLFTIMEIGDLALDVYGLGDEIARAIMGENYSPEFRDLCRKVTEKGKVYDEYMEKAAKANVDITNLRNGIQVLKEIYLDYGDRQEFVFNELKKLNDLRQQLINLSVPTIYSWFDAIGVANPTSAVNQKKLEAFKKVLGPDYTAIGISSFGLAMRAASLSYTAYNKRKAANEPVPERKRRNARADIFEGIDPADIQSLRNIDINATKSFKNKAIAAGKMMAKGVNTLMAVGSFGMNIWSIIQKQEAHNKIINDLNGMLARYEAEIPLYQYALEGAPNDAAINAVADHFDINLSSADSRSALQKGYYAIKGEIEGMIHDVLQGPEYNGVRDGGIKGAYDAMIQSYDDSALDNTDQQINNALKASRDRFVTHSAKALDKKLPTETRKGDGLDKVRDEFIDSVSSQINIILDRLAVQIDDHNSLKQLILIANYILGEVKSEEELREETRADLRSNAEVFGVELTDQQLEAAVAKKMPEKIEKEEKELDDNIKNQAQYGLSSINTFKNRSKFKSVPEVELAIREIINQTQSATGSTSSSLPFKSLNWVVQGPGTTALDKSANIDEIVCDYSLSGQSVWTEQTWTYYATSSTTGTLSFNWDYAGYHAWYKPYLQINAFTDGDHGREYQTLIEGKQRAGNGSSSLQIEKGKTFGFTIKGSNYDRDTRLLGSLKVKFD